MPETISLEFAISAIVGALLVAGLLQVTRSDGRRSAIARAGICVVAALACTPTLWAPFGRPYIEAAWIVVGSGILGFLRPALVFYVGVLPIIGVAALSFAAWHIHAQRLTYSR